VTGTEVTKGKKEGKYVKHYQVNKPCQERRGSRGRKPGKARKIRENEPLWKTSKLKRTEPTPPEDGKHQTENGGEALKGGLRG